MNHLRSVGLVGAALAIVGSMSCGATSTAVPEYTGPTTGNQDAGGPADAGVPDGWGVEDVSRSFAQALH